MENKIENAQKDLIIKKPRYKPGSRKGKGGRPSTYKVKYCKLLITHVNCKLYTLKKSMFGEKKVPCDFPMLVEFAMKLDVTIDRLSCWGKENPEFQVALNKFKSMQERVLVVNTLHKLYDSKFAWFTAKNLFGWRDEIDVNQNLTGTLHLEHATKSIEELKREAQDIATDIVRERTKTSTN